MNPRLIVLQQQRERIWTALELAHDAWIDACRFGNIHTFNLALTQWRFLKWRHEQVRQQIREWEKIA